MRVCDSVYSGGSASVHAGIHPPRGDPQEDTPRKTPPEAVHAGRYGQQVGGAHPTGMHTYFSLCLPEIQRVVIRELFVTVLTISF